MLNKSCFEFTDLLASSSAVPGGGSACAYVGALGMALGSMVGNLTVGKKKYADVEAEMQNIIKASKVIMGRFNVLVEADIKAFSGLAVAYGLPSGTDQEKAIKDGVMQPALLAAARVPLEIGECALDALALLNIYAHKGSRMVISDAGTGAVFCKAVIQGAKLNVLINLKSMKDEKIKNEMLNRIEDIEAQGIKLADEIYNYVEGAL